MSAIIKLTTEETTILKILVQAELAKMFERHPIQQEQDQAYLNSLQTLLIKMVDATRGGAK